MNAIVRAAKATYNFFAGDAVILAAVLVAFALAAFLLHVVKAPMWLVGLLFVGIIMVGLTASLAREVVGRPRGRLETSGWSDLGEVDLNTGEPAAGGPKPAGERMASFPDGNNAVGMISSASLPTGLPFKSAVEREAELRARASANPTPEEASAKQLPAGDGE